MEVGCSKNGAIWVVWSRLLFKAFAANVTKPQFVYTVQNLSRYGNGEMCWE